MDVRLLINHWGGVPYAAHGEAVASLGWAATVEERVPLSHTDKVESFRRLALSLFPRLAQTHVVVLGAVGCGKAPAPTEDPRARLYDEMKVDRCSSRDGSSFEGAPWVHDEEVVKEAWTVLSESVDHERPLLLCLNLIGAASGPPPLSACEEDDARTIPHDLLRGGTTTSLQYEARRKHAASLVHHLHTTLVDKLVEHVLSLGGQVACCATHSLSLGEYGVVGGDAPCRSCAHTFWCASSSVAGDDKSLDDLWEAFLGLEERSAERKRGVCESGGGWARVLCRLRERNYVLLTHPSYPLAVYDVDVDPDEKTPCQQMIRHLLPQLCEEAAKRLGRAVPVSPAQPEPPTPQPPPPPPLPAPQQATPRVDRKASTPSVLRKKKETGGPTSNNIRKREAQLNMSHR